MVPFTSAKHDVPMDFMRHLSARIPPRSRIARQICRGHWWKIHEKRPGNSSWYHIISFKPMIKTDQNIIKHPFSNYSNIKHLSNLNQQSSIPLIINQLWHIMIQLIKQQHPSMAPAEPIPGVWSSKRRPRGLPEPANGDSLGVGEPFSGAKWPFSTWYNYFRSQKLQRKKQ